MDHIQQRQMRLQAEVDQMCSNLKPVLSIFFRMLLNFDEEVLRSEAGCAKCSDALADLVNVNLKSDDIRHVVIGSLAAIGLKHFMGTHVHNETP